MDPFVAKRGEDKTNYPRNEKEERKETLRTKAIRPCQHSIGIQDATNDIQLVETI